MVLMLFFLIASNKLFPLALSRQKMLNFFGLKLIYDLLLINLWKL